MEKPKIPRFSSRFERDVSSNRLDSRLGELRFRGERILDLTESNPTIAGFRYDGKAVLDALSSAGSLEYEPTPRGLAEARKAVASYYAGMGAAVDADSVFLTASTSEAYSLVFKLLANPGDEILIPAPSYPLLEVLAPLDGVTPRAYLLSRRMDGGWSLDRESVRMAAGDSTAAIAAVSPNNPTGTYLKKDDLAFLNDFCGASRAALIVDEVFRDFPACEDPMRAPTSAFNGGALTFTLSGISKIAGLPQVKLGWIVVTGPEDSKSEAMSRLEFIADAYLSVSAAAQHSCRSFLEGRREIQGQILARLSENELILKSALGPGSMLRPAPREGGWYAVLDSVGALDDEETTMRWLSESRVLVHPGYYYGFEEDGIFVLSLLTRPDVFQEGLSRILTGMQKR